MYKLILLITACVFLYQTPVSAAKPTFVPLGEDCQVALMARKYGERHEAYPFDWVVTPRFRQLIGGFRDDFKHLFDPVYLKLVSNLVLHEHYQVLFVHDFPTNHRANVAHDGENSGTIVPNAFDYIPIVEAKYLKRHQRLKELLESSTPVIFIRTYRYNPTIPNLTAAEARDFIQLLRDKYPTSNVLFAYVHDVPSLDYDWCVDGFINFYSPTRCSDPHHINWFSDEAWITIFQTLNSLEFSKRR